MTFFVVFIMVVILFGAYIATELSNVQTNSVADAANRNARLAEVTKAFDLADGFWAGGIVVGYNRDNRQLLLFRSDTNKAMVPINGIKEADLLVTSHESGTTSVTSTNRGSQLASGVVGAAFAGPLGIVVGGLSGSQTTTSTNTVIETIELRFRLDSEALPILKLKVDSVGYPTAERLVARLRNAMERGDAAVSNYSDEGAGDFGASVSAVLPVPPADILAQKQLGWWQRTFG